MQQRLTKALPQPPTLAPSPSPSPHPSANPSPNPDPDPDPNPSPNPRPDPRPDPEPTPDLSKALGRAADKLVVNTFHALSLQICREHANLAGYGKDFVVRSTDYGQN